MKLRVVVACLCLVCISLILGAQHRSTEQSVESVRKFVQSFYDWYTPQSLKERSTPACEVALKERPDAIGSQLTKALKEDLAAQAKANGDIVGIDFDPFLASQDPDDHYKVGTIQQKSGTYLVTILRAPGGKPLSKPAAVAEVSSVKGKWRIVNMKYTDGSNLLSVLKQLKKDRAPSKGHGHI